MKKRLLAMLLALCLVIGLLPVSAFATTEEIVFDFGENGEAAHVDGSDLGASVSYTSGDYTLELTDMSKVYGPAYDAKGNSCIKMGTNSAIGTFTFTVPDDVTSVILSAAKYKAKNTKLTVNDTEYTLSTSSNDGAYEDITIDTSSTKTVTVASVNSYCRAMVNSITYVIETTTDDGEDGGETPDPETPSTCAHANQTTETVDATCTATGSITITCDDCGATISTETIDAIGHKYQYTSSDYSCQNEGCTEQNVAYDTIASAKAYTDTSKVYTMKGIVTYVNGKNVYMEDSTGAICVYFTNATAAADIAIGDLLVVWDTLTTYNGLIETTYTTADEFTVVQEGEIVPVQTVTLADLLADTTNEYLAERVTIEGLTIGTINTSGNTAVTDADGNSINIYKVSGLAENVSLNDTVTVTAIVSTYNGYQLLVNPGSAAADVVVTKEGCTHPSWTPATCTEPETCTECFQTNGEALGHNVENGKCTRCGAVYAQLMTTAPVAGDIIVIVNGTYAMTATASGKKLTGETVVITEDGLPVTDTLAQLLVANAGDGQYYLIAGGKYLTSGATGNSLSLTDTANDYSLWTVEVAVEGSTWYIKNVNAKYNSNVQSLEYYSGFTTFGHKATDIYQMALYLAGECEHTYVGEVTTEATCVETGVKTYTCSACGASYTEEIAATGEHTYFYACDPVCMICYEITNPNASHSIKHVEAKAATCFENGNIEYYTCELCGGCWDNENATGMPLNNMMVVVPAAHTYDNNCDWDCNICSEYRDPPHTLTSYTEADIPTNCLEEGHPGYWTCDDCGAYCKNADGTGVLNSGWMYYYGEHTAPEDTPDCAEYTCTLCKESVRGGGTCVAPEGTPECQNSTCVNCGGTIYGRGHTYATDEDGNYVTSLCQPGECVYCGEQLEKIYDCENNTWAPCCYDGECGFGCGKTYPATGEHMIWTEDWEMVAMDPCVGGECANSYKDIEPWHVYSSDCDTTCDNCDNGTRTTETAHEYFYACDAYCMNCGELTNENAAHNLTHVPAKAGTDCQTWDGNIEYWYCSDCGGCWLDETCTQTTNRRSVVCTGEHSYFYACDAYCQVCYELTNEDAAHSLTHVPAVAGTDCQTWDGNVEYWYCSDCGGCWLDETCTQTTNRRSVVCTGEHSYFYACDAYCQVCYELTNEDAAHSLTHVPAVAGTDCQTWDGNVEYWYCSDCGGCWLDETCTQTTNRRSVVCTGEHSYFYACDAVCQVCNEETKEVTHNIEHVEETCYNVEYWTCSICGGVWTDEALTLNSNRMRVIKYPATHDLEHVEETCYNVEYWYCDACQIVWADEALTQITNLKNVIKAEPSHKLVHEAESCYNTENWYCEICETVWADEALTQITNHKNVIKAEATHTLEHVAESCYNVEYWYCSACETVWTNEALTQISNLKNVIKAEPSHKLTHVEESCYNVEHWYCEICETVWADEALTQITNHKNVIKAEATHTLEHVAESCYNTEYWYCSACETVWINEALTQISNLKNVIKAEPTHKLTHVEESCYNVEHWYCEACQTVWANEALTQITNHKNVIKAEPTHKLVHVKAATGTCKTPGNVEYWYCEICQTVWADEALTQITNHKNVLTNYTGHAYSSVVDGSCDCCEINRENTEDRITMDMYRMYNPNTGEHLYTGSTVECDNLVAAGWKYEGVAFTFAANTGAPVYRLYDPATGEHLYTMDEAEKAELIAAGWNYEGVAFNSAYDTEVPQYRLHNPNATCGAYLFTSSTEERDALIEAGWEYQGIGFYSSWN